MATLKSSNASVSEWLKISSVAPTALRVKTASCSIRSRTWAHTPSSLAARTQPSPVAAGTSAGAVGRGGRAAYSTRRRAVGRTAANVNSGMGQGADGATVGLSIEAGAEVASQGARGSASQSSADVPGIAESPAADTSAKNEAAEASPGLAAGIRPPGTRVLV
ncbi:MAG: hypothetical protein BWX84_01930 [Verrucomicrobia bacterium ADurb.Bin118]|nr:MAG: hypothetical protein BWX84_01930 [Verrucomicrobia bacterium ADurb.Bin118]